MIPRRLVLALFSSILPAAPSGLERLAGRWRSRFTVIRSGRPLYTRIRLTFLASGGFAMEEFATGGALAWIYKGTARLHAAQELFLDVASVTDANGGAAEPGRARYEAGESYNIGAVEFLSAARVRIGALELQKELD
jgi:hypothetical protein